VIPIPDKKYALGERFEVKIGKQKRLKSFIFKHPMLIIRKHGRTLFWNVISGTLKTKTSSDIGK
jgi:hypothetical protein